MRGAPRLALALLVLAACSYRPARFADARPIETEADDRPILTPELRDISAATIVSEAWVKGPLSDAFDARRAPAAGDVNALDEVPHSTWFHPTPDDDARDGPPLPPLSVSAAEAEPLHFEVTDSRGLAYDLSRDPPGHPELRSATAAVTSRLVRALGWRTTEAHVASLEARDFDTPTDPRVAAFLGPAAASNGGVRVLAMRWPLGPNLGVTPPMGTRHDDPNDRIPHEDRRSLRALGIVGAWLAFDEIGPRLIRDVYVGEPDRGHVEHFLVSPERSLGASRVIAEGVTETDAPDDAFRNLWTLGFADEIVRRKAEQALPGLGDLDAQVGKARVPIPWAPHARATPADEYWAAKRLAVLPAQAIPNAVEAAALSDVRARGYLTTLLEARRRATVAHAFAAVTPAEVDAQGADALVLRDEGRSAGIASVPSWRVTFLDEGGATITPSVELPGAEPRVRIPLAGVAASNYVVVRVRAAGNDRRPMEVHLRRGTSGLHVVGVRH